MLLFFFMGVVGCSNTEEKALQYLEDKYAEEFEVMWVNDDLVTVHPKGKTDVVFSIQEDGNGYVDTYLPAKWAQELQEKLKVDIEKELPLGAPYKVILRNTGTDPDLMGKSVEEILQFNKNVNVSIIAGIKTNDSPDVSQYSQNLYNLFNLMKSLNTEQYVLSVGFVDESEDISEFINTAYTNNIPWSKLEKKVYGEVNVDFRLDPENPSPNVEPRMILNGPENIIDNYESFME